MENIRNFAIIAHVDHGKSTLADRFLEIAGLLEPGKHEEQFLDRNPISRERGITIKLAPVRMSYKSSKLEYRNSKQYQNSNDKNHFGNWNLENLNLFRASNFGFRISNSEYILNLIDTPGHVDFSYEVDRTLACVEGVILLVDATQGVQAQTLANVYKALEKNLVIIPAINKIDLPSARIEQTQKQIKSLLGVKDEEIYLISAKTGEGVDRLLQAVISKIPSPNSANNQSSDLKGLIFDSYYDFHRGVIAFVRVFNGEIKKDLSLRLFHSKVEFKAFETGYFYPELTPSPSIKAGEIGYLITGLKEIDKVRVGDTLVLAKSNVTPLSGYKKVKPMVFASIFPTETADYLNLKKALEKLYLNDSSLTFSPVYSKALGAGFRVGFLGLLHADVVRERLEREFNLSLILTPPQVFYLSNDRIKDGKEKFLEPYVKVIIITPAEYLGNIMRLIENYRGKFVNMDNVGTAEDLSLQYEMPMSEMISDFYDKLKSVSSGYASLDWEFLEYRPVEAGKLELLLNDEIVEEFSEIVAEEKAYHRAYFLVGRLKELIPRQQFEVKIQARYKGRIIAAERISPIRKNVLMKAGKVLGTGDVGRKRKLLERQKEGKKKMKMVGKVEIPKEVFVKLFRND